MITIFHTADVHFGVENYGKIDGKTGIHTRLLDFKNSLEFCIDRAVDENIDLFVLSGDAYKTAYPTPTQQKLLAQLLFKLHKAAIPVVIIIGNHDHPLSFGKANALDVFSYLPIDGFYVFSKPDSITIQTKNGPLQIVGIPWPTRNTLVANESHRLKDPKSIAAYLSEKVGLIISSFAQQLDSSIPALLAGHLTVSSGIFSGSEKCAIFGTDPVLLPSQLALEPFDYVALGHLHRHQNLNPNGYPPVVYAGSIERVDFGERKEDKGFCKIIITTENGKKNCSYEFIKVPTRPMIQLNIKLEPGKIQTDQIIAEINNYDLTDAIVKITYQVPEGKTDHVDLYAIQRACIKAMYVVGIFPIHQAGATRESRIRLSVDMDLPSLLSKYFDSKKEFLNKKAKLIEKALKLHEEIEHGEAKL